MQRDLNDAWLRTLETPTAGRVEIRDTRVSGLILRMTSTGATTWCIRTRTKDGKQTRLKMGTYPEMGIADARKAARKMLASVTPATKAMAARW